MAPNRIAVRSHAGKYSIVCGTGALKRAGKEIAALGSFSSVHIITAPKVWRAVAKHVPSDLVAKKSAIHLMKKAMPRRTKICATSKRFCRSLVRGGADRKSLIVAIPAVGVHRRRCGVCGGFVFARCSAGACADDACIAGREHNRWQDRRELAGWEKSCRSVLSAAADSDGSGGVAVVARS